MISMLLGCALFFGVHSVGIVAPQWRERMVARLGPHVWQGLYSLVALAGFALMLHGYGLVRAESPWLYAPPAWSRHAAFALMLPVFPLLLAAYLPGRLTRLARHPMLLATMLWSCAHLISNGRLADMLLFGGFGLWALLDVLSLQKRLARNIRRLPEGRWNDWLCITLGLGLYVAFVLYLHGPVTGVVLT